MIAPRGTAAWLRVGGVVGGAALSLLLSPSTPAAKSVRHPILFPGFTCEEGVPPDVCEETARAIYSVSLAEEGAGTQLDREGTAATLFCEPVYEAFIGNYASYRMMSLEAVREEVPLPRETEFQVRLATRRAVDVQYFGGTQGPLGTWSFFLLVHGLDKKDYRYEPLSVERTGYDHQGDQWSSTTIVTFPEECLREDTAALDLYLVSEKYQERHRFRFDFER